MTLKNVEKSKSARNREFKKRMKQAAQAEVSSLRQTAHKQTGRLSRGYRVGQVSRFKAEVINTVPYGAVELNYHPEQLIAAEKVAQPKLRKIFKKRKKI